MSSKPRHPFHPNWGIAWGRSTTSCLKPRVNFWEQRHDGKVNKPLAANQYQQRQSRRFQLRTKPAKKLAGAGGHYDHIF
jgi:hypothetical protein